MELNPNHPVTSTLHDHWHTVALMIMRKFGVDEIVIKDYDVQSIESNSLAITVRELPDGLHVKIVSMEEGLRLARKEGGLPV